MKTVKLLIVAFSIAALCYAPALAQGEEEGFIEGDVYPEDGVTQPVEDVDISYFFDKLAPHGEWIWTPEHGWVWQPRGVWEDWRPYTYGRWAYTDYGWTWSSHFQWGWAPFHYGSWAFLDHLGWIWVPGTVWAPAWVMWRHSDAYIGWAPILAGYGYYYGWAYFPVYYHHWTFIGWNHFCDPHPHHHYVPRGRVYDAFRHTYYPRRCRNKSGSNCQRGPDRKVVSARTNTPVKTMKVKNIDSKKFSARSAKVPLGVERDTLKIHRPRFKPGPQRMEVSGKTSNIGRSKDLGPIRSGPNVMKPRPGPELDRRPQPRMKPPQATTRGESLYQRDRPFPGKAIHPKQPERRRPSFSKPAINRSGPKIRTNRQAPSGKTMRPTPKTHSTPKMTPRTQSNNSSSSSGRSSSGSRSGRSSRRK